MKVKCVLATGILAMAVMLSGVATANGVESVSTEREYYASENTCNLLRGGARE